MSSALCTVERRSTDSTDSSATPASWREISSRSASSVSNRSSSLTISSVERRSAGSSSALWSSIRSAAMRTVVSGVRSSWLTSEVNRRCRLPNSSSWVIWRCRLSAMSLNDTANRAMSSSPRTGIRSDRCPSANRSANRDAERTGSTIWRATSSAIAASRPSSTTAPVAIVPRTSAIVLSSLLSGKIRYSSRLVTGEDVGLPMINAGRRSPRCARSRTGS